MTSWSVVSDWSGLDSNTLIFYLPMQDCNGLDCYVMIVPECPTREFELTIFNRWGEVQFETTKRGDYWNADTVDSGAYIYQLSGIYLDGSPFKYHARFDLAHDEEDNTKKVMDSCEIFAPNVVTPDCDWIGCDYFEITADCKFKTYEFKLYNRWGEVLIYSNDPKQGFHFAQFDDGVYIWTLKGEFRNGQEIDVIRHVTILK